MLKISKLVSVVVGLSMALTLVAGVGSASAQAMSLGDLVNLFISLGIISPDKAAAAKAAVANTSSSVSFTRDLTIGSSGADVSALQSKLGVSPASGYFGSLTKAAVVSYQAANGIPSTGYVGPLTRAKLNAGSSMTSTTPSTPSTPSWTNTGVEGSITVTKTSVSNTTAYEGDTMKPVVAFKVEAKLSDINVQRVKLDLSTASSIYSKIYKTVYIVNDAGAVLAQADLNANTVVKENGTYYLTLGGFSYVVAKDSSKVLTVKADLYSNIDSGDMTSRTISVVANGVRGVDGAGIDQYGPSSAFSQTISLSANLADSATLKVSTNSANFKATDVVAADGANSDELDGVALLALDIRAEKDNVTINSLKVDIADTADLSTTTTAYLYDGSTLVASESVTGINATTGYVLFGGTSGDLDYTVSKDATKTLVVKVDVRSASATGANTLSASVTGSTTKIDAENSAGDTPTISGSATGESMVVRKIGPVFTLVGSPTIVRNSVSSNDTSGVATSTGSATFHIGVKAVGGDILFGDAGSTTPAFATTSTTYTSVYKNGASVGAPNAITAAGTNATVSYSAPSSGVVVSGNTFTLQQNNSTTLDVTFAITVTGNAANNYGFQLNGIRWANESTGQTSSTFMTDKADWRTGTVSLP